MGEKKLFLIAIYQLKHRRKDRLENYHFENIVINPSGKNHAWILWLAVFI